MIVCCTDQRVACMPITDVQNIHTKRQNNFAEKILFCVCIVLWDVIVSRYHPVMMILGWWDGDRLTLYLSRTRRTLRSRNHQSSVQRSVSSRHIISLGKYLSGNKGEIFVIHRARVEEDRLKSKGLLTITILSIFRYPHSQCTQYIITSQGVTISSLDTHHLIFLLPYLTSIIPFQSGADNVKNKCQNMLLKD